MSGDTVEPRARGPKGLAGPGRIAQDPTFVRWGDGAPIAPEHRGSLAEAESEAAYRWAAPAVKGRDVLDVGSGAGHGAGVLLDAGARSVVGVDHNPDSVEAATRLYGSRARFLRAEAMALPFAASSFDVVTCFGALETAPDQGSALGELRRLLADDGLLLVSLRTDTSDEPLRAEPGEARPEARLEHFANVRLYRRRLCVAAAIAPVGPADRVVVEETSWLAGTSGEDRAVLAAASDGELPPLPSVAAMTDFRDLRQYRATVAAWEERARQAEADGSAKHWEFVAAREAQRRLRKRVHELEHRPLRMLWRVLRGGPARLGQGPPIRASERGPGDWD